MKPKWRTLSKVKEGRFFMLDPDESDIVWVRGHYDQENQTVEGYKFYDPDYIVFWQARRKVFVDFKF